MNERIKELMEYAVRFRLDPDSNTHEALVQPEDLELFAELIVRECADVLRQESERLYKLASEEEDEVFAGNFEICAEKCVANEIAIKDHFGVTNEQQKKNP